MAVLIEGINIPEGNPITVNIYRNGTWVNAYTAEDGNAIEVPEPHGRLGDLDRLEQILVDIENSPYSGFDGEEYFYSADDAEQIIRLAPTVIPASEEAE
jgi:hypothetical protein